MKEKILVFLHSLTVYDLIYFGAVFLLFILLIVFVLFLRQRLIAALLLLLVAILEISLGPTIGFRFFHNTLFKNEIVLTKTKRLHFVKALVIKGKLKNISRFDFKSCLVQATVYKETHNKFKNLIFKLKPIKQADITIKDIPKGADGTFEFFIEPFTYKKDFNVSVKGVCR